MNGTSGSWGHQLHLTGELINGYDCSVNACYMNTDSINED